MRQKVVLSCRDGGVRAAIHAYNDEDDLERLVDVVRAMIRGKQTNSATSAD